MTAPIVRSVSLRTTNSPLASFVDRMDKGEVILDPPYQRGSVWGVERQRNLIRSLTMGLPIGAIFVNDRPFPDGWAIIDGKQRLEAVASWLHGDLTVPRDWFPAEHVLQLPNPRGDDMVSFNDLTLKGQRSWDMNAAVAVYWADFKGSTMVAQEAELFDLVNFGGVPQGDSDVIA